VAVVSVFLIPGREGRVVTIPINSSSRINS